MHITSHLPAWRRRCCGLTLVLTLVGCNNDRPTPPAAVKPSSAISHEDAAKLLDGVAAQLDALKDALSQVPNPPDAGETPATRPEDVVSSAAPASPQPEPSAAANQPAPSAAPVHPCAKSGVDADADGLPDACEDLLAEIYAPVMYYSSAESHFPTNVDQFLPQTVLWFSDQSCDSKLRLQTAPNQAQLVSFKQGASCDHPQAAFSNGTRSKDKVRGFYLEDLPEEARTGSKNAADWITYVHVYRNRLNGATIQYWRMYAYHDGGGEHGGDWDAIHVQLDSQLQPVRVGIFDGDALKYVAWKDIDAEGSPNKTHPRIFVEADSHQSHQSPGDVKAKGCKGIGSLFSCHLSLDNSATFIRHETWKDGQVSWFSGETGTSPGLLNLGEKRHPLNNQWFIQYSGLWGSPGRNSANTGEWGPAYHRSGLNADGYINAWAANMLNPPHDEAYPLAVGP